MLQVTGKALLNGAPAPVSAAIFPGDQLQTSANSGLTIAAAGTAIVVGPNSSVVFTGDRVDVLCGSASIQGGRTITTRAKNFVVAPAGDSANYDIVHSADLLAISSRAGTLIIDDGRQSVRLEAGSSLQAIGGCTEAASQQTRASAAPPQTGANAAGGSFLGDTTVYIILGVIVAASVAAVAVAVATREDESPSQ